jgi:hypothetical protein
LERLVRLFRCVTKNVDPGTEENEWVEGLLAKALSRRSYIRVAVRQEMQVLQFEIVNIPSAKMNKIQHVLEGDDPKSDIDHVIAMYI